MINTEKINKIIYDAIDEINSQSDAVNQIRKSEDTTLYGQKSKLDSLGLVNLIVDIEQRFQDSYGISINLADEKALSQKNSPFLTVKSLSDYISKIINENISV